MDGLMSLVNAVEYHGYKIKEWNIVQFAKLTPVLGAIAKEYEARDIQFSQFSSVLSDAGDGGTLGITKTALSFLSPIIEHAPVILQHSLGLTASQLEELPFSDGTVLVILVLKINMEHVAGFFAGLTTEKAEQAT